METTYIVIGVFAILVGPVMLWIALPDKQGRARAFLQGDSIQSIYAIAIIAVMLLGVALVASELGVVAGVS